MMYGNFHNGFYGATNCLRYFNHGGEMIFILGIVVIGLLIFLFTHNHKKRFQHDLALDTLKMKYVQGEITEEEFLRRKELIGKK